MAAYRKLKLSGSTDGRMILVAATATPGTLLHTAQAGTTTASFDEIWLYAVNSDTTPRKLTIEFGGTTSPGDVIELTLGGEAGLSLIVPGLILQNGSIVRAFTAVTNLVSVGGYINEIKP